MKYLQGKEKNSEISRITIKFFNAMKINLGEVIFYEIFKLMVFFGINIKNVSLHEINKNVKDIHKLFFFENISVFSTGQSVP